MWKCLQIMHVITAFLNELFFKSFSAPIRKSLYYPDLIFCQTTTSCCTTSSWPGRLNLWDTGVGSKVDDPNGIKGNRRLSLFGTVLFHLAVIQPSFKGRSILFRWDVHFLISGSSIFSLLNRPV